VPSKKNASKTIKLYSELGRLADAVGEDRFLRIWYGLRYLDDGRGWVPDTPTNRIALVSLGVAPSQQSLRKLLRQGEGTWWRLDRRHNGGRTIALVGLKAISIHVARKAQEKGIVDLDRLPGRPIEVPLQDLSGSLASWRAILLKVWIAGRKHQRLRIDWATMEQAWGRSRTTLMARCKQAGVEIVHNWAVIPISAYQSDLYPWSKLPLIKGATTTTLFDAPYQIWQRPNTYKVDAKLARKGQSKKVHKAVRHALDIPARVYVRRQYFDDPAKFGKTRSGNWDLEVYLLAKAAPWGQFWEVWPAYR
jgi:hypothetical protein